MLKIWQWNLRQISRQIWVPVAALGVLGVATAGIAALSQTFLRSRLPFSIGAEAVSTILEIMAASMLTVTTFSLSIMLSAFASAATGATPRATALLRDDGVTQSVLATFVGAFVFSLTGIIGVQSGLYAAEGRFILFCVTLLVVTGVILQLMRWIGHLAVYGRLSDTLARVEAATERALRQRIDQPYLGGVPLSDATRARAEAGIAVDSPATGYVNTIDMPSLNELAKSHEVEFGLDVIPGSFAVAGRPLLHILPPGHLDEDTRAALCDCVVIAADRNFDQDPRFGLLTLSEIAQRALSPAVNDPGTAIDVLGRQMRLLSNWRDSTLPEPDFPQIHVPGLKLADLMDDAFAAIARDGAGAVEVQLRLQKMLAALASRAPDFFGAEALRLSDQALLLAGKALSLETEIEALAALNAGIRDTVSGAGGQG